VRIQRIVRQARSRKFFVFNNPQWFESHPLRHHRINDLRNGFLNLFEARSADEGAELVVVKDLTTEGAADDTSE
jgi:predicted Zn-dependent protease